MKILLVHGAGATNLSWRTFEGLVGVPCEKYEYDVNRPFEEIVLGAVEAAKKARVDHVVGHSFGGVVAWHVADRVPAIRSGVSVSTPWGGNAYSDICEFVTLGVLGTRFFANLGRENTRVARVRPPRCRWLNVVTTRGIFPGNDGVVTVQSQLALHRCSSTSWHVTGHSHGEILQTDDLPTLVRAFVRYQEKPEKDRSSLS